MIPIDIIGEGAHWSVKRILTNDNGQEKSVVRKHGRNVDANIATYDLVFKAGLPTLNRYVKVNDNEIEAEDLNADTSKAYFVSPNTIRNYPNCGDVFLKYINSESLTPLEREQCKEFDFSCISKMIQSNKSDEIVDQMRMKKIAIGAEGKVYNNKIQCISNLKSFCSSSQKDLEKATSYKIELYSDAFFFRVNPLNDEIEYIIADFDCIRVLNISTGCPTNLLEINQEEFKTALLEFICFFVVKERQKEYKELIKKIM